MISQNKVRHPTQVWRCESGEPLKVTMSDRPRDLAWAGGKAAIPFEWRVIGSRRRRSEARAREWPDAQLPVMFSPPRPGVMMPVNNPDSVKTARVRCRIAFYIIPSILGKALPFKECVTHCQESLTGLRLPSGMLSASPAAIFLTRTKK